MYRISFICLGNICRSPMAELVTKDILAKRGSLDEYLIDSAATSDEEVGNRVYPPVAALLNKKGIDCSRKRAQQLTAADGDKFDLFVCMDESNIRRAESILGSKNAHKCVKLLSFCGESGDVSDPWYTRDFETCYRDVLRGVTAMLAELDNRKK